MPVAGGSPNTRVPDDCPGVLNIVFRAEGLTDGLLSHQVGLLHPAITRHVRKVGEEAFTVRHGVALKREVIDRARHVVAFGRGHSLSGITRRGLFAGHQNSSHVPPVLSPRAMRASRSLGPKWS